MDYRLYIWVCYVYSTNPKLTRKKKKDFPFELLMFLQLKRSGTPYSCRKIYNTTDSYITSALSPIKGDTFLVSHSENIFISLLPNHKHRLLLLSLFNVIISSCTIEAFSILISSLQPFATQFSPPR